MKNKIFTRIIITTLLCAFLTLNVGKVTRVSAVGTTAAIAGTAFILTGAVYLSYLALTQSQIAIPKVADLDGWLGDIGRKVTQYPSGAAAYQDIYQGLVRSPLGNVIDGVWEWTQDRIKAFVNDFSDTRIIQDITSYEIEIDTSEIPLNGYDYTLASIDYINDPLHGRITVDQFYDYGWTTRGTDTLKWAFHGQSIVYTNLTYETTRNYFNGSTYTPQYFDGTDWITIRLPITYYSFIADKVSSGLINRYFVPVISNSGNYYDTVYNNNNVMTGNTTAYLYPPLVDSQIYDADTDTYRPLVIPENTELVRTPQWLDPDNENRPIIPWVPIPDIPTGVPTPPGYTGPPTWGFPLAELLDLLEELAEGLMEIDAIARLINDYAGQHGDNYYLEYNDGDTNYYTYYQPTVFDNDTEYVTYNINVSEEEDTIPVNLNTISQYSNNRYLEQIKRSALNGSSIIRDLAVFWYDVDPEVTYIALGICIIVLLGAFTGKLGHS